MEGRGERGRYRKEGNVKGRKGRKVLLLFWGDEVWIPVDSCEEVMGR